jgi:uncharacterized protein YndB with AHSA1/START domain
LRVSEEAAMEVKREVVLPAPREEVWSALTDAERLAEWFANEVELDAEPGGEGVFRWDNGEERRATVDEVEPQRAFGLLWDDDSHVAFTLEDDGDGTLLTVVETAPGPRACAAAEWTWGVELWSATLPARFSPHSPIPLVAVS